MLSIEVFRPDEMLLNLKQIKSRHTLKNMGRRFTAMQQPDNPYLQVDAVEDVSSEEEDGHRMTKFKDLLKKQKDKVKHKK